MGRQKTTARTTAQSYTKNVTPTAFLERRSGNLAPALRAASRRKRGSDGAGKARVCIRAHFCSEVLR